MISNPIWRSFSIKTEYNPDELFKEITPHGDSYQSISNSSFKICACAQNSHRVHRTRDSSCLAKPKPVYLKNKSQENMSLWFTFSQLFARFPASSHLQKRGTENSLDSFNYTWLLVLTIFVYQCQRLRCHI